MLILPWMVPSIGRGVVTLDLVNCTEVRGIPGPPHRDAVDDIGNIAARMHTPEVGSEGFEGSGVSARERVRWVSALW